MDRKYLIKQFNTYWAVVEIPKHLRKRAGQVRYKQSLKTDSLAEANKKKHAVVAEFQRQIAALAIGNDPERELMAKALSFREALQARDGQRMAHRDQESSNAGELLSVIDEQAREVLAERGQAVADRFRSAAIGKATFIVETYRQWLDQFEGAGQTKVQHESAVNRYVAWAAATATIEETIRKQAGDYINSLLASSGLSRRTIQRHTSSLSSLWRWYIARGLAESNPWLGHGISPKKGWKRVRKGLTDEAILKLLNTTYPTQRYRQTLHDLLRLDLLSGVRIEALCSLKCTSIEKRPDGYYASIENDKTEAGTRIIPLHSAANGIVERRLSAGGVYLFEGLTPGGPDKKRSWHVTKAYKRFRTLAGVVGDGEVFHALRNTFIERMEGHGIPESTTQLLVGHDGRGGKRSSITYGLYSEGTHVDLRTAIERLDYGSNIMSAIRA